MSTNSNEQQQNYAFEWVGQQTDKGPTRPANEDALWVPHENTPTQLGALYVVADGVGGQQFGAAASQLATQIIPDVFYAQRQLGEPISVALKQAIQGANLAIYDDAQKRGVQRMGSTIVAAVQEGRDLHVANVGDARAYLLRDDELKQLTQDDTWVQRQVDAGVLTLEEAAKHNLRNVVTQVLGNTPRITIHLAPVQLLAEGDCILLCSDGLYDAVSAEDISQILDKFSAREAVERLIVAATAAPAKDNITAVVVKPTLSEPDLSDEPTDKHFISLPQEASKPTAPAPQKQTTSPPTWLWLLLVLFLVGLVAILGLNLINGGSNALFGGETAPTATAPLPTLQLTAVPATPTSIPTPRVQPDAPSDAESDTETSEPTATPPP
ncbi:MAG: protein phosphatase 2C domain-containing protein [Chloroflexota bacterium]